MKRISTWLVIAGLLLILGVTNHNIWKKERVLDNGRRVLLELRPLDPRSLMQGDYMMLRYSKKVFPDAATLQSMPRKGVIVVTLDADDIGTFARRDDGSVLAEYEQRLQYKLILEPGELRIGAESFFFQEGQAEAYADAVYGVLRVDANGASVLAGLADGHGVDIVAPP